MHGILSADRPVQSLGFNRVANITSTVVDMPDPPVNAVYAYIQADGGALRWRDDGTDPTATIGHYLDINEDRWYTVDKFPARFIRDTDETETTNLHVTYYAPI
jgi:hypothetical protein